MDQQTKTELEAAAFRRLLKHLDERKDVQEDRLGEPMRAEGVEDRVHLRRPIRLRPEGLVGVGH